MTKKRVQRIIFAAAAILLLLFPLPAGAEVSASADYVSSYFWRGFDLNPVRKPVIQPAFGFPVGQTGLYLDVWGSISFEGRELFETDLTLSYSYEGWDNVIVTGGIIHYGWYLAKNFSFDKDTTQEIFFSTVLPNVTLQPSLTLYYDFTNGDGLYLSLAGEHSFTVSETNDTRLSADIGFNGGQWLPDDADPGFSDANFGIDFIFKVDKFEVLPTIRLTSVLMEALGKKSHIWYGVSVRYTYGH
ncbi:MAG: hypothetical protein ABIK95_00155 [Acidobacteriota bacterium]